MPGTKRDFPKGKPYAGCLTCPRYESCPLVQYIYPCVFRNIYIRQERRALRLIAATNGAAK